MIVSNIPIRVVDFGGSILMIVFSFLCLNTIRRLKSKNPDDVMWEYLLWICLGLAIFAISRSVGHILKQIVQLSGDDSLWEAIRPFSGGVNTMMFVVVAPSFEDWGKFWDAYADSAVNAADELNADNVVCPDSVLWESFKVE